MTDHHTTPTPAHPPTPDDEDVDLTGLGDAVWTVGQRRGLLILEVAEQPGGVFTGRWIDPDRLRDPATHDESLVVHLTPVPAGDEPPLLDVRLLLAHNGRWQDAGMWAEVGEDWPDTVRPTCRMIMHLLSCPEICDIPTAPDTATTATAGTAGSGTPAPGHGA